MLFDSGYIEIVQAYNEINNIIDKSKVYNESYTGVKMECGY
jgi:hypothetical protein